MLVLSRRLNQKICLPGIETSIEIVRVKGEVVRVGIQAPDEVNVVREEIWDGSGESFLTRIADLRQQNHDQRGVLSLTRMGLGLAILQMRAESTEGEALKTLESLAAEFDKAMEMRPSERKTDNTRCRALLVEDSSNEREMLAAVLRMSGIDVISVADGRDAIQYLCGEKPDVVLLDMNLPVIQGSEVVSFIRQNPAIDKMKIFAISGEQENDSIDVDKWYSKPLNPENLISSLLSVRIEKVDTISKAS